MCEIDILPGPAAIITRTIDSITKSHSHPPWETKNPFSHLMWNIAPSKITAKMEPVTLVNTPTTNSIPPMNSANAIGSCISGGIPILINHSCQLLSNFFKLCTMNIAPIDALIPQWVMSCTTFPFRTASVFMNERFWNLLKGFYQIKNKIGVIF